jgi:hypothetical protein
VGRDDLHRRKRIGIPSIRVPVNWPTQPAAGVKYAQIAQTTSRPISARGFSEFLAGVVDPGLARHTESAWFPFMIVDQLAEA